MELAFRSINIGKAACNKRPFPAVLGLCPEPEQEHTPSIVEEKQATVENGWAFLSCLRLVRANFTFNQRVRGLSLGGQRKLIQRWVERDFGPSKFTDSATTLPEPYATMCSNW